MARMFQQRSRLLVAISLSPAVVTHVAVSTHKRVLKHVSVCVSELFIFSVCCTLCMCVLLNMTLCACFNLCMYVRVTRMSSLMHGYDFVCMLVCLRTH